MATRIPYNSLGQIVSSVIAIAAVFAITTSRLESQTSNGNVSPSTSVAAQSGAYGSGCPAAYKPGTYGFIGLGQELAGNPFGEPAGPIASLLVVQSNGDGTLTVQRTDFADGVLFVTPTVPGTYTVGDDCTVTDTIPIPSGGPLSALTGYGAIVQDGVEVDYMATTPGVVVQNYVGRRMPQRCTNATLSGVYAFNGSGTALSSPLWGTSAGPLTSIGTLYFDGNGNFTKENQQDFVNGSLFPIEISTGTYSVAFDCRLTITTTTADNFTASGLVVDGGNAIDFIPTMPGVEVEAIVGKKITTSP